jgi:signal transduction histidine kinase
MEETQRDIVISIVLTCIIIMVLAVFTLLFFLLFINKKTVLQREKVMMKLNFEQNLLQTQLEIQEQTLRNISQEIHDNIGQILSLVSLNLNLLVTEDISKLNNTIQLVDKAMNDLRDLSKSLNPERVQHIGLKESIEHELRHLERTGRYSTSFDITKAYEEISPEKTIILYRMIQEVLNNIIKHAEATQVVATLSGIEKENTISISDNGKGFDVKNSTGVNGIGLQNIHKRAGLINATVEISSEIDKGTTVTFKVKKEN